MKHIPAFVCAFIYVIAVTAVPPLPAQTQNAQTQKTPPKQASLATLIQSGRRDEALQRIRAGADVNEPQPDGTRPIHWAVYRVDYDLVDALIAKRKLVRVLADWCPAYPGFFLYYPSRRQLPAALRAFVDFARGHP